LDTNGSLLVITVVTGFDEAELDLFLELRRYYGSEEWASETPGGATPGQLFDDAPKENRRTATEYVYLLVALDFQGCLVEESGRSALVVGDDTVEMYTREDGKAKSLDRLLGDLGLVARTVR